MPNPIETKKDVPAASTSATKPLSFAEAVARGRVSQEEALALFDSLPAVEVDFMLGAWKGAGFPTGHPLDGVLERYHWHGKRFDSAEHVHPLVFARRDGSLTHVNPLMTLPSLGMLERMPALKSDAAGSAFRALIGLVSTKQSAARLRATTYRGVTSATMQYDNLPINDVFRKVDERTVLGVMDLKGVRAPFFFVLRRE
ncbi:MAG: DUF4334 domain-containing protein [Polyangiales bacterium]|nr:DUF4334 domain-containing protein [Sandaracinaceae bacterium]